MPAFVHPLWGYALDYPEGWVWREDGEVVAFAPHQAALEVTYDGPQAGHLVIRPELNPYLQPLDRLWTQYITRIGIMRGAKKMGAAPLKVGALQGYEAELLLPRKQGRRLWVGLLAAAGMILHVALTHRVEEKGYFQPLASRMVQSLRFVSHTPGGGTTEEGVPLPPGYRPVAPQEVLPDATPEQGWSAYRGEAPIAALQAFYLRELPYHGWQMTAYYPFPNRDPAVTFAGFSVEREGRQGLVALVPHGADPVRAHVALRFAHPPLEESE